MTIPARFKFRQGWRSVEITVTASRGNRRPRVLLRAGRAYLQLDGARAIRLCNEVIDRMEEVRNADE